MDPGAGSVGEPCVNERLIELLGDVQGLLEIEEFRRGLLDTLRRAIPSDWISLNDFGPDPADAAFVVEPPATAEQIEVFRRLAHENPGARPRCWS